MPKLVIKRHYIVVCYKKIAVNLHTITKFTQNMFVFTQSLKAKIISKLKKQNI